MTNNTLIQKPAPFQQPVLVDCTTGCGRRVAYDAPTCPNCGRTDPAILRSDPQQRTAARKAYDESPAVRAWNDAQQQLAEHQKQQKAQQEASQREILQTLQNQYDEGHSLFVKGMNSYENGKNIMGIFAIVSLPVIISSPSLWGFSAAALGVTAVFTLCARGKMNDGDAMKRDAINKGYSPPYPRKGP